MKKGVALLITVALVAAIAALIGISAGILENSFKRTSNKQFMIQSNSFMAGFVDVLRSATSDVNDSMTLDLFLSFPLAFEQKSRDIQFDISFTTEAYALNPNNMLQEDNTTQNSDDIVENRAILSEYEAYFDRILTIYNVSDKILLLSMIADSVDDDVEERTTGSELAIEDPFFSQGKIYAIEHFEQILEGYKRLTLDYSVDKIPWDTLLSFRSESIDLNHVEMDTMSALFPDMDAATLAAVTTDRVDIYEDYSAFGISSDREKELQALGAVFYAPQVKAWMNIRNGDNHMGVTFSYDLETKKVSHIEITN